NLCLENIEKDNAFFSPSFSVDELTRIFHGHHPTNNTFDNHFFTNLGTLSFHSQFSHPCKNTKHQILTTRQDAEKRAEK